MGKDGKVDYRGRGVGLCTFLPHFCSMDGDTPTNSAFVADWRTGVVVKVKAIGDEIEGEIFGYDSKTDLLVLSTYTFFCSLPLFFSP